MILKKKIEYLKENTDILDDIKESNIKQIESDYYNSVYFLLKDGTLYKTK